MILELNLNEKKIQTTLHIVLYLDILCYACLFIKEQSSHSLRIESKGKKHLDFK